VVVMNLHSYILKADGSMSHLVNITTAVNSRIISSFHSATRGARVTQSFYCSDSTNAEKVGIHLRFDCERLMSELDFNQDTGTIRKNEMTIDLGGNKKIDKTSNHMFGLSDLKF